jgi:hypothetical protein
MLNRIEVRRIRRKIFKQASGIFDEVLNFFRLMKRGVVHDNNSSVWQRRQKCLPDPCLKNIRIDAAVKQSRSQQPVPGQCADNISPPLRHPVMFPETSRPFRRIAEKSGHLLGKTAFIDINQRNVHQLIDADLFFEELAGFLISLWMGKSFFAADLGVTQLVKIS